MNSQDVEQEIQDKGLTAPRVTLDDIEANIASEHYFTAADAKVQEVRSAATEHLTYGQHTHNCDYYAEKRLREGPLGLLTFCVLVLRNGFTVTGESACASPDNFDAELGRKIARQNAVQKMWPLMGYHLKQRLHEGN